MGWPFLTARWSNLFLATYIVPEEHLHLYLPPGLTLDKRDGQAFVSLVAFDFLDTRVLGIPWPGFRNFAELNLRFYVRRPAASLAPPAQPPSPPNFGGPGGQGAGNGEERGVVFIREFVPQRLVAWLARTIYNEPYLAAPLTSQVHETPERLFVEHRLVWGGQTHVIRATGRKPAVRPATNSVAHFFKEHEWGYGVDRRGRLIRYQVVHPIWDIYPIQSYELLFDFGRVYGPAWGWLTLAEPYSTILAVGSQVAVYPHGTLK